MKKIPGRMSFSWPLKAGLAMVLLLAAGRLFAENPKKNHAKAEEHYSRALALAVKGEGGEAAEEFREAIRWDPDYAEAHYNLGMALSEKGDNSEGIKEFREAARIKPDFLEALMMLASALDAKGERKEARGYWVRAEKLAENQGSNPVIEAWIRKRLAEPD